MEDTYFRDNVEQDREVIREPLKQIDGGVPPTVSMCARNVCK
jgi:hypothetical protein